MLRKWPTTKLKLKWLNKHRKRYEVKVESAFLTVKQETIEFLNTYKGPIDILIKYLAKCTETSDVQTFISLIGDIVKEAKKCSDDPEARKAILICSYIIIRFHLLSHCTTKWVRVKLRCKHCRTVSVHNFLYTDKLCPICGNVVI